MGERVQQNSAPQCNPNGQPLRPRAHPATINLARSRDAGVPAMRLILAAPSTGPSVIIARYSGNPSQNGYGAIWALHPMGAPNGGPPPVRDDRIAVRTRNGGFYDRFPGLFIPFIIDPMTP